MDKVFRIQAEISINKDGGRTWTIKNGYRPGFKFINGSQTSGAINLLNLESLSPGENGIVEVSFISDKPLGSIKIGDKFKFYEGPVEIGNGKVVKVLGWV